MSRVYKLVWTVLVGEYDTEAAAKSAAKKIKLDKRAKLVIVKVAREQAPKKETVKPSSRTSKSRGR